MGHAHTDTDTRRVQLALVLTGVFTLVEFAGGLLTGSLALLADAGHMLTDTMALALAAVAFRVSARPADSKRSFGYQRFQILAAFVNGLCLIGIVGWIVFEALARLLAPPEVAASGMLYVACAGLIVNVISFIVLHGGDRNNLNMRGAAVHVLGDLLGSLAAISAAIVILISGWLPIDPLLSLVVAMLVLNSAWQLVRRSGHILLEGTPEWLQVGDMQQEIERRNPEVAGIHHVHVWGLTPQHLMLTMHVVLNAPPASVAALMRRIKATLRDDYGIRHSTIEIEMESDTCADHAPPG